MNSNYIIIEGPDGSGKSTTTALIEKALTAKGYNVVRVREFDATEGNKAISKVVLSTSMSDMTRLLLVSAMRKEAFLQVIEPALLVPNTIVLADRGWPSTLAYQCKTEENKRLLDHIMYETSKVKAYVAVIKTDFEESRKRMASTGKSLDVIELGQDEAEYNRLLDSYSLVDADIIVDSTYINAEQVASAILDDFLLRYSKA